MAPHPSILGADDARRRAGERLPVLSSVATYLSAAIVQCRLRHLSQSEAVGELLEGTLVFADISGFTTLSEQLAPHGKEGAEELTIVLNSFFDRMVEIIAAHGGDVLQFGGDSLLIAFGAEPVATTVSEPAKDDSSRRRRSSDAALAAIRCGLQMQAAMQKFAQIVTSAGTFHLGMSLGAHHGKFLIASAGACADHVQQVVMGKAVHRLLKVEAAAERGNMLVTDAVRRLVKHRVPLEKEWHGFFQVMSPQPSAPPVPAEHAAASALSLLSQLEPGAALDMASRYLIPMVYRRILEDPAGSANEGEHRFIATMFVNFAGMSEMMRSFGEERIAEVVRHLDSYLAGMAEIIVAHGGSLARVSADVHGDKLLVLFGAPIAIERPEQAALACALEMNQRLQELNAALPIPLQQKIGVASGSAFCGNVGSSRRREYTVIADQANIAARLAVQCELGEILVSRGVWHKSHEAFRFKREGPLRLRGKKHSEEVYQLIASRDRPLLGPHWKRRLVGRASERRTFRRIVDEVLAGKGQVLALSGEAGVGKSRLIRRFAAQCRAAGMTGLFGQCDPHGASVPYFPWRPIIKGLLGLGRLKTAELSLPVLESKLAEPHSELAGWAPLVGTVIGAAFPDNEQTSGLTPRQRKEKVFSLCLELLRSRIRNGPLFLVIEDVHWFDPLSHELLDFIAESLLDAPVLILVAHRPDAELAQVVGKGHVSRIDLKPLSKRQTLAMLGSLTHTPAVPRSLATLVHEKSHGNPLYVEELLRALVDGKQLAWDEPAGQYSFDPAASVDLPSTIQNLILSRIDRLSEEHRRVLQTAAVFGRSVPRDALRAVLPFTLSAEAFDACLTELASLELLVPDKPGARGGEVFHHSIVQEVVYESLLFARRRETHRAIGDYIERTHPDRLEDQCDVLARHFDLGRHREKALHYLVMAGDKAKRAGANAEAANYFTRALDHLRQPGDDHPQLLPRLLEDLGDVQAIRGDYSAALEHYQEALACAGQPVAMARIQGKIGSVAYRQGRPREGIEHLDLGLAHLGIRAPRSRWQVRLSLLRQIMVQAAHSLLPRVFVRPRAADVDATRAAIEIYESLSRISFEFDLERTLDAHLRQLNLCETIPDSPEMAQTYSSHGIVCGTLPWFGRAIRYQQRGLAIREGRRDRWGIAQSLNFMGICYYWMGKWNEALACLERSERAFREVGDRWESEVTYLILSFICLRRGELERAAQHARTCLDLSQRAQDPQGMGWALGALADARARQGKLEDALAHAEAALNCSQQAQDSMYIAVMRRLLGEVHLKLGRPEQAIHEMQRSVQQIHDHRLRHEFVWGAYAGLAEASLAMLPSLPTAAAKAFALRQVGKLCRRAVKQGRSFPNWLGSAYRVSALFEWASGRPRRAAEHFERSIEASSALGARCDLACAYYDLGRFRRELDRPGAVECFDQAVRLFEQCGAAADRVKAEVLRQQLLDNHVNSERPIRGPHGIASVSTAQESATTR